MYQTKSDLALAMLQDADAHGLLQSPWVLAPATFGQDGSFRDALDAAGWWYMLEVPLTTLVFAGPAVKTMPLWLLGRTRRGRPRQIPIVLGPEPVETLAACVAPADWRFVALSGEPDEARMEQYAPLRLREYRDGRRGRESWLVLRRDSDGRNLTAYLSNAPANTPADILGRLSRLQRGLVPCLERQKAAIGLIEYEVRSWFGWHHHIVLSLLAGAFLLYHQ
jgi:hypothetical protein